MGGDGYTPEVRLLDRLVRMLEEQRDPASLAHYTAYQGAAHDTTQGILVRLREVAAPGDVNTDIRLRHAEAGGGLGPWPCLTAPPTSGEAGRSH